MKSYSLLRRTWIFSTLAELAFAFPAAFLGLSWIATPICATGRDWTGAASANWSDPNNWSPVGIPQNGDSLNFGYASDSNRLMENDLTGLIIVDLSFHDHDYQLNGNALTVISEIYDYRDENSDGHATTFNCPLVFPSGAVVDAQPFCGAIDIHFNGPITVDNGVLNLIAEVCTGSSGAAAHLYVSGVISGSGDVWAEASGSAGFNSTVEFNGTPGNTFSGTLYLTTFGDGQINFNKSSGFVATNRVATRGRYLGYPTRLNLAGVNQIGNNAVIQVGDGSQLLLSGNDMTVGSLVLTNYAADTNGSILDTGNTTVALNGGITSGSANSSLTPVVKGNLNLKGALVFNIAGSAYAGLDLQAFMSGLGAGGFTKTGSAALILDGINTFEGLVNVTQGILDVRTNWALGSIFGDTMLSGTGSLTLRNVTTPSEKLIARGTSSVTAETAGSLLFTIGNCNWTGPIQLDTNLIVFADNATLSGRISGPGGMDFRNGTAIITGTSSNTYSGTTLVRCPLLEFNKGPGTNAYAGPLVVGGNGGGPYEARWLNAYQNIYANLTLYSNGIVNLNNHNEDFSYVTFNGGEVDTGTGQFAIYQPLTVNPVNVSATINGFLGLPAGDARVFIVGDGAAGCDLIVNAVIFGTPTYFVKQGAGTMCLTATNSYDAVTLLEEGILDVNNGSALGTVAGTVIFDGATLRLNGSGTMAENFEIVGAGVGGTHGALEAPTSSSFTFTGDMLLDGATTFNVAASAGLGLNGLVHGTGPLTKIGLGNLGFGGGGNYPCSNTPFGSAGTLLLAKSANKISVPGDLVVGPGGAGQPAVARLLQAGGMGGSVLTVNGNSLFDLNGFNQILTSLSLNDGGDVQTGVGILGLADSAVVSVGSSSFSGSHVSSSITGNIGLTPNAPATFSVSPYSPLFPFDSNPELDVPAVISVGLENPSLVPAGISKSGAGRMRLAGNNSYVGQTIVNDGTLQVDGSQPSSPVVVNAGARLQGVGTAGPINLKASSATLAPGNSPGILTCSNFDNGGGSGVFQVELNGTTAGSGYDQLNVRGTVNLNKMTLSASLGFASSVGDQFTIINNDGIDAINGTFSGLPQSAKLYISGQLFQISYTGGGRGNGVLLTRLVTPPPPVLTIERAGTNLVRLRWPTNNPAFRLISETNLTAANWSTVSPSPVVIGTNDVVTNTASDLSRFYRLVNP